MSQTLKPPRRPDVVEKPQKPAELAQLRQELLKRILNNEAQRRGKAGQK
ncbi:MAG: hypothetical protein K6T86_03885 [Pirellulales bacterium]|jgi:hypothetical protein|nr:hypothetical protein [Pirellulales bacterium]